MPRQRKKAEVTINTNELLHFLVRLLYDEKYPKRQPFPKFTIQEFRFIRDLIFQRPKGLLFYYLADHLMNDTMLRRLPMFNAPSMRKLRFIYNFLGSMGSAKEAAIRAGFSPITAKQQASRILKEINGYKRPR